MSQAPPPNPIAAGPGDGRVLSRPSSRVHEPCSFTESGCLRPQTVLTGSGSRRYSYGGFGGGHSYFHPHTADLRITSVSRALLAGFKARASFKFAGWQGSLAVEAVRGHARNDVGPGLSCPGHGPGAPPLFPIGLTAAVHVHGNKASRFGNHRSQDRSTQVPDRGCQERWVSAGSPTALKRVRALLQQLDRARVHRPGSGGREFRP